MVLVIRTWKKLQVWSINSSEPITTLVVPAKVENLCSAGAPDFLLVASCDSYAYVRTAPQGPSCWFTNLYHSPLHEWRLILFISGTRCPSASAILHTTFTYGTVTGRLILFYVAVRYGICREENVSTSLVGTAWPYVTLLPTRRFQYWLQAPGTGQFVCGTLAPTGSASSTSAHLLCWICHAPCHPSLTSPVPAPPLTPPRASSLVLLHHRRPSLYLHILPNGNRNTESPTYMLFWQHNENTRCAHVRNKRFFNFFTCFNQYFKNNLP